MMDDLLNEYIEQEKQLEHEQSSMTTSEDNSTEQENYDNYIERTKEYYYKMSCRDFIYASWFTITSCYICGSEYMKYKIGWKSRNNAIIDVSKRLAAKNMMYVKIFQAFATNKNIVSPELNQFFSDYTDNVEYSHDEYDDQDLLEIEHKAVDCYPYKPIKILNN